MTSRSRLRSAAGVALIALASAGCSPAATSSVTPAASPIAPSGPSPFLVPSASPIPNPYPIPTPTVEPQPSPFLYLRFLESDYGVVVVATDFGAVCNLKATYDDGSPVAGVRNPQVGVMNPQVVSWAAEATWVYPQPPASQDGLHVVTCSWQGLSATLSARFDAPG